MPQYFPFQDIFRKYPNKYETVISTLCEYLESLDEPEARAAMIWIVGEYAERIDNADEILQSFLDGFHDENTQVREQRDGVQQAEISRLQPGFDFHRMETQKYKFPHKVGKTSENKRENKNYIRKMEF